MIAVAVPDGLSQFLHSTITISTRVRVYGDPISSTYNHERRKTVLPRYDRADLPRKIITSERTALQLANEQRSAYGLRYSDFARYRKHCGNRTHRLRSTLKMTHGKGKDFKKLPPLTTDIIKEGQ